MFLLYSTGLTSGGQTRNYLSQTHIVGHTDTPTVNLKIRQNYSKILKLTFGNKSGKIKILNKNILWSKAASQLGVRGLKV